MARTSHMALVFALGLVSVVSAQTVSTEILGIVTDATGAVLPSATVTARRVATGDVRTTRSNETGNYIFPLLEIGDYEVTCSVTGFKTEVRRGITLQLQQKLRMDFQMQIGDQVETVEVTGAASLLRTEDRHAGIGYRTPSRGGFAAQRQELWPIGYAHARRSLRHFPDGH